MAAQLACTVADVPQLGAIRVELMGATGLVDVAVVRDSDGALHAIGDPCSHGEVSLSDGDVDGCTIECWLHGSRFDLRTGRPTSPPAVRPVPVYSLTLEGDDVLVDLDQPTTVSEEDR